MPLEVKSIHPFPARMAPEIALLEVKDLPPNSIILDPMAGSGTVLHVCSQLGYRSIGFDIDPLAVLMAKVITTPINALELMKTANSVIKKANNLRDDVSLSWLDEETSRFMEFWFAKLQAGQLRRLSAVLAKKRGIYYDVLRVALSKMIITKSGGASLARDTSHSRPHKVKLTNDYDVFANFIKVVCKLSTQLENSALKGQCRVARGDCRKLPSVRSNSIDAVITSPPYLSAIDYLRGHKLALVWLGYSISQLKNIRAQSIGTYYLHLKAKEISRIEQNLRNIGILDIFKTPLENQIKRYALDIYSVLKESKRTLRIGGKAVFVIGDSFHQGIVVSNLSIIDSLAKELGFTKLKSFERAIPENRRYLPPPTVREESNLALRMKKESVVVYVK